MMAVMQRLLALWRGEFPLEIAFWRYAIFYGLFLNIAATAVALALIVADLPIAAAIIVHLLPVPYMIVTMAGVWRSADRHAGPPKYVNFARIGVVAWAAFWLAF